MTGVPNTSKFLNLGHNARLGRLLRLVENRVHTATSDADLVAAISLLDGMPTPVQFQPSLVKKVARYGSYLFAILAAILILTPVQRETVILFFGIAIFCYIAASISKENETDQLIHLSEQIHSRSSLFDYGLRNDLRDEQSSPDNFIGDFKQFQSGTHTRSTRVLLSGHYQGADHSFDYRYFHILYTSSYGAHQSKQHTHNRCGFILPFAHVKNLRITDNALKMFQPTWNSGSADFNARFSVSALNDMDVAKFLKPALLREVEEAGKVLSYIDIEFNADGYLCFSFDDVTSLKGTRRTGLHFPEAFKQEIMGHNSMPQLDTALEFLHRLMKYSDNNFENSTDIKTGSA